MTKEEITEITKHIEIHTRREPRAIHITEILRKAVVELVLLQEENAELKVKVGLSIDCEKAQKNGEFCLGYGGDEDEPCERCKNCIKCECGYYQLGETEKDVQLTKAKDHIKKLLDCLQQDTNDPQTNYYVVQYMTQAEQFIKEIE